MPERLSSSDPETDTFAWVPNPCSNVTYPSKGALLQILYLELTKIVSVKVGITVGLLTIGDKDLVNEAPILISGAT